MAIENNNVVTLNYILHTIEENGEKTFVEQTTTENPLTFLYGVGMMLPKFEENIAGLNEGDKTSFDLAAADAYGERDDRAIAQLPADMFKETGLPPLGEVLPLQDNQGNQFRAVVVDVTPEAVVADLNHPMAGKTLSFEIEVLNVRPATQEELSHGHAHGIDGTQGH
ncbi:peptidylprolyl isomerase [Sphingobacterium sp. SGL-16]|jgi:FKBP-type peptidyl-prolyl cis-trans isomerase SlyD|uniref:FKBP-type peptidyl-prolyl cis-trans isomerase n=1 Tax=Sphingobacterium sp. SGL-16 TaxID=2710883 RepID=UPI0013EC8D74|nr:peptidylprolyl isomerase [Sphingobacterium sp. SGL-16]NGM72634.1 peptidylprolyl isomerase [Sphingobacterium sp. SGL-16]